MIRYSRTESTSRTVTELKADIVSVGSSSIFLSCLTALAGEKSFGKSRIGATLTRCPMREPQLQGVHPAHSCHLMHDIREQRIRKPKAVGCCGPCLVRGKAVSLYLSIKAGFLLFIMHSSHQDITNIHSQLHTLPTRHLYHSIYINCNNIFNTLDHLHPLLRYTRNQVQT